MGILQDFPLPKGIELDEATATETYGKFTAAPFQSGFGHTLGNALRRVLLSSLEGCAISAIRIEGVSHEFATAPKIVEDVAEIILNMKKILLVCNADTPRTLEIRKDKAGEVTGADIITDGVTEVLNKDQIICTLDKDVEFRAEIDIDKGRGYRASTKNKKDGQPVGTIPIDSLFSPVRRVRYVVGSARVGEATEMDSLELEIWTDGRLAPMDALEKSAKILKEHLRPFLGQAESQDIESLMTDEEKSLYKMLVQDVDTMNLSVRSQNCLNNANIKLIGELCNKPESKMLKYKNFGKKSLDEITEKLQSLGLDLGMTYTETVNDALLKEIDKVKQVGEPEGDK